jgi:hypothetical protein
MLLVKKTKKPTKNELHTKFANWLPKANNVFQCDDCSFDNGSSMDPILKNKAIPGDPIPDENESRGSPAGSPKSFDSHSSIEDKVSINLCRPICVDQFVSVN